MFDIWTIPDESDLSDIRDTLLQNGMFQSGRSGTEKEYQDFERDEIELHNNNFAECLEYDQTQSLKEVFPGEYGNA